MKCLYDVDEREEEELCSHIPSPWGMCACHINHSQRHKSKREQMELKL